jgi:PilZ domain
MSDETGTSSMAAGAKRCVPYVDRRFRPRYDVLGRQLVYVDLGSDNGGVVLNCSEGGMAIQTVAPLVQHPGHEFFMSLPDAPKPVFAIGDIVWVNELHEVGIRFAARPGATPPHLAAWLNQTAQSNYASAAFNPPICEAVIPEQPAKSDGLLPELAKSSLALSLQTFSEHSASSQDVDMSADEDVESWATAFTVAAVFSLVLTLLAPHFLYRATHLPAALGQDPRPASAAQRAQNSVSNATPTPATAQTSANSPQPQSRSVSPPQPHPAGATLIRSHPRHVRRGDDDDEVIVRHFARPVLPSPSQEQQKR